MPQIGRYSIPTQKRATAQISMFLNIKMYSWTRGTCMSKKIELDKYPIICDNWKQRLSQNRPRLTTSRAKYHGTDLPFFVPCHSVSLTVLANSMSVSIIPMGISMDK